MENDLGEMRIRVWRRKLQDRNEWVTVARRAWALTWAMMSIMMTVIIMPV